MNCWRAHRVWDCICYSVCVYSYVWFSLCFVRDTSFCRRKLIAHGFFGTNTCAHTLEFLELQWCSVKIVRNMGMCAYCIVYIKHDVVCARSSFVCVHLSREDRTESESVCVCRRKIYVYIDNNKPFAIELKTRKDHAQKPQQNPQARETARFYKPLIANKAHTISRHTRTHTHTLHIDGVFCAALRLLKHIHTPTHRHRLNRNVNLCKHINICHLFYKQNTKNSSPKALKIFLKKQDCCCGEYYGRFTCGLNQNNPKKGLESQKHKDTANGDVDPACWSNGHKHLRARAVKRRRHRGATHSGWEPQGGALLLLPLSASHNHKYGWQIRIRVETVRTDNTKRLCTVRASDDVCWAERMSCACALALRCDRTKTTHKNYTMWLFMCACVCGVLCAWCDCVVSVFVWVCESALCALYQCVVFSVWWFFSSTCSCVNA